MEIFKQEIVEKIISIIKNKKNISYCLFEELFGNFEKKIQYKIMEELEKNDIFLVDSEQTEEIKINSEIDFNISFLLEEAKKISNLNIISEKKLKDTFDFLDFDEYAKVKKILKEYNYSVVNDENTYIEKKNIFYDEEQIRQLKKLSNEELVKIYQNGNNEILETLILKNYKFIYYVIRKEKLYLKSSLEEEDLFQEGIIGLKKAIDKYHEEEGNFTTYAYYWVNQQIRRAIMDKGFLIRLPVNLHEKLGKIINLKRKYCDKDLVREICNIFSCTNEKAKTYLILLENYYSFISLNKEISEYKDSELLDFIVGENPINLEKEVQLKELYNKIEKSLEIISKKNKSYKDVIIKRYGLNNKKPLTLEEIGKELNVTRERIRQIQEKVENRLKKHLIDYKDYSF